MFFNFSFEHTITLKIKMEFLCHKNSFFFCTLAFLLKIVEVVPAKFTFDLKVNKRSLTGLKLHILYSAI